MHNIEIALALIGKRSPRQFFTCVTRPDNFMIRWRSSTLDMMANSFMRCFFDHGQSGTVGRSPNMRIHATWWNYRSDLVLVFRLEAATVQVTVTQVCLLARCNV